MINIKISQLSCSCHSMTLTLLAASRTNPFPQSILILLEVSLLEIGIFKHYVLCLINLAI